MAPRPALALTLAFVLACGGGGSTTTANVGDTTGTTDTTGTGTGTTDTTGTPGTSTTTGPTTGSDTGTGTGTDSASGDPTTTGATTDDSSTTEISGASGGQGSGMACMKWYAAIADTYEPICACEVKQGNYPTIDACLTALAPSPDCACDLFAASPETAAVLACYEQAAQDKADCLAGGLNLCLGSDPLDLCILDELAALLKCGAPPAALCQDLKAMCGDAVPPICG